MATESITALQKTDRIHELTYKARGIVQIIRHASGEAGDMPDGAIPGACWAVESMLSEITALAK